MEFAAAVGVAAAAGTTLSYIPQVWKAWRTRSLADLPLPTLCLLATGLALWIAYGVLRADPVIVTANGISLFLAANLVLLKSISKLKGESSTGS